MVRFIFLCMAVVALSFVTLGAQSLMDSMGDAETSVMARNAETSEPQAIVNATKTTPNDDALQIAESLNDINTAAGVLENENFGDAFTNVAPKALADESAVQPANTEKESQDSTF